MVSMFTNPCLTLSKGGSELSSMPWISWNSPLQKCISFSLSLSAVYQKVHLESYKLNLSTDSSLSLSLAKVVWCAPKQLDWHHVYVTIISVHHLNLNFHFFFKRMINIYYIYIKDSILNSFSWLKNEWLKNFENYLIFW